MKSFSAELEKPARRAQTQPEIYSGAAAEWDAFVTAQPGATASHLFAWKRIIKRVYQHDCPYLAMRGDDGELIGVLPLVDMRSVFFGRVLVSMPFLNGGGPLGCADAPRALSHTATQLAAARRARMLELRCGAAMDIGLVATTEKVGCVLPLAANTEAVWAGFPSKLRSQIRRAQKEQIEVRFGPDQLAPFFSVFERNMRDLGSPAHRPGFFSAIAEELSEHVWFGCAYHRGKPVAAGCGLQFGDEVEMTWASSLREYNALAPNMLLYWSFMRRATELGLRRFNFGRSTPNTGTHRFKQQWGAIDATLHWYRAPAGASAAIAQDTTGASLATRMWRHLPVAVATGIGSRLRGGIPA